MAGFAFVRLALGVGFLLGCFFSGWLDLGCIGWVGVCQVGFGLGWLSLRRLFAGLFTTLVQVGFGLWIFTKLALGWVGFGFVPS